MKDLIKITENNGQKLVSARELYQKLGYHSAHWSKWYKKNIINNEFAINNIDYTELTLSVRTKDFALNIDFAKKLSMLARTPEGENVRKYFIEVEKQAKKPLSQIDLIIQSAQMLKENELKLKEHDSRLLELEAKTTTRPDFYTVAGFGTIKGIKVNLTLAANLGRKASRVCKDKGIETGKIKDPRFGYVKTYPFDVLDDVFNTNLISPKL